MITPTQGDLDLSRLLLPIQPGDHVYGLPEALYTFVEYGDYECPDCLRLFTIVHSLQSKSEGMLRLVYRHYPRSGIHPHAQQAAEAAEAAGAQGRFWDMHNLLFANQKALSIKNLHEYGERLSLDAKRYRDELKRRVYRDVVTEHFRRGVENGVYGTPGLFINGRRDNGPLEEASLVDRLNQPN